MQPQGTGRILLAVLGSISEAKEFDVGSLGVSTYFWGLFALIALAVALTFLTIGTLYARRLESDPKLPYSEQIGAAPHVIRKLRKRESMTREEFEYAQRIVAIRGNPMAFCIPFTLFTLSVYYVFGCLEYLQGATPSERSFIGVIPMFTSTNLAIQLFRAKRLKSRLRTAEVVD